MTPLALLFVSLFLFFSLAACDIPSSAVQFQTYAGLFTSSVALASSSTGILYAASDTEIYRYDPTTGSLTLHRSETSGNSYVGLAFTSTDTMFYSLRSGIYRTESDSSATKLTGTFTNNGQLLYDGQYIYTSYQIWNTTRSNYDQLIARIDPITLVVTDLVRFISVSKITTLAWDSTTNVFFGHCAGFTYTLYRFASDWSGTTVVFSGTTTVDPAALIAVNGFLYYGTGSLGGLGRMNITTGVTSTLNSAQVVPSAFALSAGTIYAVTSRAPEMYRITAGGAYQIINLGTSMASVKDFTVDRQGHIYYGSGGNSADLFCIKNNTNTAFKTFLSFGAFGSVSSDPNSDAVIIGGSPPNYLIRWPRPWNVTTAGDYNGRSTNGAVLLNTYPDSVQYLAIRQSGDMYFTLFLGRILYRFAGSGSTIVDLSSVQYNSYPLAIAVDSQQRVWLAHAPLNQATRLMIINVTNPAAPIFQNYITLSGVSVTGMAIDANNNVYLCGGSITILTKQLQYIRLNALGSGFERLKWDVNGYLWASKGSRIVQSTLPLYTETVLPPPSSSSSTGRAVSSSRSSSSAARTSSSSISSSGSRVSSSVSSSLSSTAAASSTGQQLSSASASGSASLSSSGYVPSSTIAPASSSFSSSSTAFGGPMSYSSSSSIGLPPAPAASDASTLLDPGTSSFYGIVIGGGAVILIVLVVLVCIYLRRGGTSGYTKTSTSSSHRPTHRRPTAGNDADRDVEMNPIHTSLSEAQWDSLRNSYKNRT